MRMENKAKYYAIDDLLYYKRIGKTVWFTCRQSGTNKFYNWHKKGSLSSKTWIETIEQHPCPNNPKPISMAKLKEKGINP